MAEVFISHAADAKPLAEELVRALERAGISTWADYKDFPPGDLAAEEIERAVGAARSLVMLVSPQCWTTRSVGWEWQKAVASTWDDPDKTVIPVILGGTEAPPFLREWKEIAVASPESAGRWTDAVLEVVRAGGNRAVRSAAEIELERRRIFDELEQAALRLYGPPSSPRRAEADRLH